MSAAEQNPDHACTCALHDVCFYVCLYYVFSYLVLLVIMD